MHMSDNDDNTRQQPNVREASAGHCALTPHPVTLPSKRDCARSDVWTCRLHHRRGIVRLMCVVCSPGLRVLSC